MARTRTAPNTTPAVETPKAKTKKAKKDWAILPSDRIDWVVEHARPAVSDCLCGCGGSTKGRFVPGHDATLKTALAAHAEQGNEQAKAALATFGW